ncbi:hypothetical protein JY92_10360 [Neisseria meningitidis]|nr:hypothetical protein JY21_09580 [Neisseria meningitidis]RPC82419.1 hypothetical protein JY92_10360 [Neisseria meningitidis]
MHNKDFVENKGIPFLLETNDTTQGICKGFCYPHSNYFTEVPEQHQKDKNGNIVKKNGEPASKAYKSMPKT